MNNRISHEFKIASIYFIAGTLWILLSDTLVSLFTPQSETVFEISISKGVVFVLLTTLLIYFTSRKYFKKIKNEILEREQTESELKQERELLDKVTETSPIAITILNPNGHISYANIHAEKLLMISKKSIKELTYDSPKWKITDFEGNEFPKENLPFNQVIKTNKPVFDIRHAIELESGRKIFLSINASPIFSEDDNSVQAVIAVMRDITETIQYEKRLVEYRITYRGIFDSVKEAIYIHDKNRVVIDVNKRAEELFGYTRSEIIGKTYKVLAVEDKNDTELIEKSIDSVFEGNTKKIVFWGKDSSGKVFPAEVNLVKGRYFDNEVLIAVVRDISDRVKMEEELRASEEKYRVLFNDNPQSMWVYNLKTLAFIDVNNSAVRKYGYSRDEFLSMDLRDIRPKEDVEKIERYVGTIREKNNTHHDSLVWKHKTKDGTILYVKILSHRIELNGKQCRIVLATDVTDVIQKENALKESEKRYRRIFENIVDVYYETSIQGEILELSPSIYILSYGKYKREELLGRSMTQLYVDEDERKNYVNQLLKHGRVYDHEIRLRNKDGKIIYCSITSKLISSGSEQRIVGSLRDISVRRNYEEDLIRAKESAEKANQLKSEFLAQMSHEIRTPLNIILNSTQLIKDELSPEQLETASTLFGLQKSAGVRIIKTIDSILNMSELQTGTYEPDFTEIDLVAKVLNELIAEYKVLVKEKPVEIKLDNQAEKAIILGDRYSVTQILSNLIDNAVKYTNEGEVIISVVNGKDRVKVDISDTGIGISKEFIPYLFDAFRQEQQGYSRVFEGNGLGLALVKKFCEINNAEITVQSERGKGSTFSVSFPTKK